MSITEYRQKEYIIASALGFHDNFDVSGHDVTLNMDWQHLTVSGCSKERNVKELKWWEKFLFAADKSLQKTITNKNAEL